MIISNKKMSTSANTDSRSKKEELSSNTLSLEREVEDRLVLAAKTGDTQAFTILMNSYEKRINALIFGMIGNQEDSKDISSEVFARAWKGIVNFKGESGFGTWVHSIARNHTLNFLRVRNKRSERESRIDDLLPPNQSNHQKSDLTWSTELVMPNFAAREENRELLKLWSQAKSKLSADHCCALELRVESDLNYNEIAKQLGIPQGTARSRVFYAKKQVAGYLSASKLFCELKLVSPSVYNRLMQLFSVG